MNTLMQWMPEANLINLQVKLVKLNKRAAKIGCAKATLEVVNTRTDYRHISNRFGEHMGGTLPANCHGCRPMPMVQITLVSEPVQVAGWEFIGTVEHVSLEDGTTSALLRAMPGKSLPDEYRTVPPTRCDHCHIERFRRDTYIVTNGTETKIIGRSCLRDFTGIDNPENIARQLEWLAELAKLGDDDDRDERDSGYFKSTFTVAQVLLETAIVVRHDGRYISKTAAMESTAPLAPWYTARTVWQLLMISPQTDAEKALLEKYSVNDADKAEAVAALAWVKALSPQNDFERNINVAGRMAVVTDRDFGIIAAIIPAYQRAMGKAAEAKVQAQSRTEPVFVGEVGKKVSFTGTLKTVREMDSQYSKYDKTTLMRFEDVNGNRLVWWATGEFTFKEGDAVKVTGTVKAHDESKYGKETKITRCKVESLQAVAA